MILLPDQPQDLISSSHFFDIEIRDIDDRDPGSIFTSDLLVDFRPAARPFDRSCVFFVAASDTADRIHRI